MITRKMRNKFEWSSVSNLDIQTELLLNKDRIYFVSVLIRVKLVNMNTLPTRKDSVQRHLMSGASAHESQYTRRCLSVRLLRKSALSRADVQPARGLRTLNFALAGAAALKRSSGRSATTSALLRPGMCLA
jgi:hypothetical protein